MRILTYMPNDVASGPRIGGTAPVNLASQFRDDVTQYFGTFPLPFDDSQEFSIFHRIDPFDDDPIRDAIINNNQILHPPDLIWSVVHPVSYRSDSSQNTFEARGLVVGEETDDLVSDDDPTNPEMIPYDESKLGGSCYVDRVQVSADVRKLEASGFQHLLQIGLGGPDAIAGFPWDPGFLNVWAKEPTDPTSYRFCLQQ